MIELIEQLRKTCQKILKLLLKNLFTYYSTYFLGHEIGNQTIKPFHSTVDGIRKLKTSSSKRELMCFLGSMNFYSEFIQNLHISLEPFYTLLQDDVSFKWTPEIFESNKLSLKKYAELAIPNSSKPFYITVDASLIGLGAVLFQPNSNDKMQVI